MAKNIADRATITKMARSFSPETKLKGRWLSIARVSFVVYVLGILGLVLWVYSTQMASSFEIGVTGIYFVKCSSGETDCVEITEVIKDSPADKAGILPGLRFLELDGISPAIKTISGPVGSTAVIKLQEEDGDILEYKIVRDSGWAIVHKVIWIELGFSHQEAAAIILTANNLVLVASVAVGLFIAVKRSDDWMALLAAAAVIGVGSWLADYTFWFNLAVKPGTWLYLFSNLHFSSMIVLALLLIFLMPDGKLHPSWGWALVVLTGIISFFGNREIPLHQIPAFLFFMVALNAQIYQYRHRASPEQRQQQKWILFGLMLIFMAQALTGFMWVFVRMVEVVTPNMLMFQAVTDLIAQVVFLALPVSLLFSAMQYRLWDIDAAINRTLVYGFVTAVLGAVFLGGYFILQELLAVMLGEGQAGLSAGLAGAAAVAVFNPARSRLRRFIDRTFYGIKLDYEQAIKGYKKQAAEILKLDGQQTQFGNYGNLMLLGRGGMGEVYLGRHIENGQTAAIKMMPEDNINDADALARFKREADAISNLNHPNIVSLYEYGEANGQPYMVMEYIRGKDLKEVISNSERMSLEESRPILEQLASGLDYAHGLGIIHRDIKPSNVMIETTDGGNVRAVLMDFGIAKVFGANTQLTQTGGFMGTLDYVSPDHIRGTDKVTDKADQYSFAIMVYEMLTGRLPFEYDLPVGMIMAHMNEPPPDPKQFAPELSDRASFAIQRALAKFPESRFENIVEFVANLI